VTIPQISGGRTAAEYSFDGLKYSESRSIAANPGETVTGYARYMSDANYNASSPAAVSIDLPLFRVQKPAASPSGGSFTDSLSVTLASETSGAAIYYTLDGAAPTSESSRYDGAITLNDSATLKAIAVKSGMADSEVLIASYTKQKEDNVPSNSGGAASVPAAMPPAATPTPAPSAAAAPAFTPMTPSNPIGTMVKAEATASSLVLDGKAVPFPAVSIENYNWMKLRDVAAILNNTNKQFAIGWDAETNTLTIAAGERYIPVGDELRSVLTGRFDAMASPQKIVFNGKPVSVAAYNINGYNYFRLRDIAILLDFSVKWDALNFQAILDLTNSYAE
jgi:hypothetical protein